MEDRVNFEQRREFKTVIEIAAPFENLVRAKLPRTEFKAGLVNLDVFRFRGQLDQIANIEGVNSFLVTLVLFLHAFLRQT